MSSQKLLTGPRLLGSTPARRRSSGVLLVAMFLAGGCSTNTYKPSVDAFASAANKASDAYAGMQATVLSSHTELLKQRALKGQQRVRFSPGECEVGSERCRLQVTAGGKAEALVTELGNITLLTHEIADYATNLQAVVNSTAAQDVSASLAAAGGSIGNLAADLSKLPGGKQTASDFGTFAAPSANLAAWVAGEYIDLLQVEALRKATQGADPVIQQAKIVLEGAASAARDATNADLADQLDSLRIDYFNTPADSTKLERLMSAAADYDKVLMATAPGIFADMAAAHHQLTSKLAGQNVTLAEVFAAIQQFGKKAEALRGIVEQFRAAQEKATAAKK